MGSGVSYFDPVERARQKQASRDRDELRLKQGLISPAELRRENSFFGCLPLHRFEMVAIGGKPIDPHD